MDCQKDCICTFTSCSMHGMCCECLSYHLGSDELPACCFPEEVAKTSERGFEKFVEIHRK